MGTIHENILSCVGQTPVVRLNHVARDVPPEVLVKCEYLNPGGSVKDRIGVQMLLEAEKRGEIQPGDTLIEATSGNTGIGLALVCAAKGYRLILTMPESMSLERRALLRSYGAEIILTPEERVMEGAVAKANALCAENDSYFKPDQFGNPANPEVHRLTTAPEILEQTGGEVDGFVSAIGTGGTVTGVGSVLRERNPNCVVIGVEPATSAVLSGCKPGPHKIQGIGAGFVPDILDRGVLSRVETITDREAYDMSKRLAREEGLLVGISAGANVAIAGRLAKELGKGKRVVTVLCDTGERYFSLDEYFQS